MTNEEERIGKILFKVDEKPPLWQSILFGFQHLLIYTGGLIIFPMIVGSAFGLSTDDLSSFIGVTWVGMGIATFLQIYLIGSKLPVVQGPSFSFIPPAISLAQYTGGGITGMATYMGSLILGGIFEAFVGYSKIVGYVKKIISPITMSVVIILIGLGLFELNMDNARGGFLISMITFFITMYCSLVFGKKKPMLKASSVLIGLGVGYLICLIGSFSGIIQQDSALYVTFTPVTQAPWVTFPVPFRWGKPIFKTIPFLIILAGYIPSIVESIGDYHAYSYVSGLPDPSEEQINRGIGSEGVGSVISSVLGGPATTSYTENLGAIAMTGVASKYVIGWCAAITIALGLFRKIGVVIATIPEPVQAGVLFVSLPLIIGSGLENLTKVNLHSIRNLMVIGASLFLGLGLPYYIETSPILIPGATWIADVINSVLSTPMSAGLITAIILDNLLPGTLEERGVKTTSKA